MSRKKPPEATESSPNFHTFELTFIEAGLWVSVPPDNLKDSAPTPNTSDMASLIAPDSLR